jgi:hypothetical protein
MKIIERAKAEQRKMRAQILREIFIMKRLKHKSVVELKGLAGGVVVSHLWLTQS